MILLSKMLAAGLVVISSMTFVGYSQVKIDTLHEEATGDELLYIPSKSLLKHFTAGMSNVVADLLWLETIQYTVREFHSQERKFTWLEHMINAVADLDPHFVDAYANGSMFLSSIGADEQALKLLKKGFIRNPQSFEIPHEIVKLYVLNRRDRPESPAVTTHYLRMLAERHEYPELYLNWARHIQEANNLDQEARAIWEDVLNTSEDEFIRELAHANLRLLIVGDNVRTLSDLVGQFKTQSGRAPFNLEELIDAGLLADLPSSQENGAYFIDLNGEVQNTILIEDTKRRTLMSLNGLARTKAAEKGRNARTIEELFMWLDRELPPHPVPGGEWQYDPTSGAIS